MSIEFSLYINAFLNEPRLANKNSKKNHNTLFYYFININKKMSKMIIKSEVATKEKFKKNKEVFLKSLQSKTSKTNKYKRYLGSPLRYAGGKSLAVGQIVEFLPTDISRIVSPFIGGGSVEIAINKEIGIPVVGYDVFDLLINYWDKQINNTDALVSVLKMFEPTKDGFNVVKEKLKKHWLKKELIINQIELAAYYYFNHNTSYGPGFLSWPSSVYTKEERYKKMLKKVADFHVNDFRVEAASFEKVISNYQHDMLYLDPPYYLGGESKMFKGVYPQRNFPIHHKNFNHELLCDLLKQHKGKFILSYNDCPEIRKMYSDFEIVNVGWQYTMGQGETRIGKNRINANLNHIKESHEILIINYEKESDEY